MADREAKTALFDSVAAVAKAMGSGRRGEIVDVLSQGERSVDELAIAINQSVANTSHHLQVLSRAGLVTARRDGTRVYYRLSSDRVAEFWSALCDVAGRHVAGFDDLVDGYLGSREGVATVTRDELVGMLDDSEVVLLDVRPQAEFASGHIPSALPIDPDHMAEQLADVPKGASVVAYCRGPYCAFAVEAVRTLQAEGVEAKRLEGGFPDWRRDGLPVESGPTEAT